jgi:hypothetical protein
MSIHIYILFVRLVEISFLTEPSPVPEVGPRAWEKICNGQIRYSKFKISPLGKEFLESSTMGDLCRVFNLEPEYRQRQKELGMDEESRNENNYFFENLTAFRNIH